jgi:hypothetical protein
MCSIIPHLKPLINLIRLINSIYSFLYVPEMVNGDIVTDAAEFALKTDAGGEEGGGAEGVERGATLRVGVVVVILGSM